MYTKEKTKIIEKRQKMRFLKEFTCILYSFVYYTAMEACRTIHNAKNATNTTADAARQNAELAALLAAHQGQPFTTPAMMIEGWKLILGKITELAGKVTEAQESASDAVKYLPADKLAKRYGMTAKGIAPYLLNWSNNGDVDMIKPVHPVTGRPGVPRYCVADVDGMMQNRKPTKCTKR